MCRACSIRSGVRHFCDTGCNVIDAMQRAAEAEWWVQRWIIREAPVPLRVRQLLARRRRALDVERAAFGARFTVLAPPRWRPTLRTSWALLFVVPLLVVLYRYVRPLASFSPPSPPPQVSTPPPAIHPAPILGPDLPSRTRDLIRPTIPQPAPFLLETDLSRGLISERKISLTFDGGAEANATEEILDTLKSSGVRTTIFLTGQYISRHPDLVRRMVRDGHEIGNHTFSHPRLTSFADNGRHESLPGVTREFVQTELRRTAELFAEVAGTAMSPYWRAPYGEHNPEIRKWATEIGYLHVGWTRDPAARENLDTRDWVVDPHSPIYHRPEEVRERILNFGKGNPVQANGGIILLHLGTQRKEDRVHRELPAIIDGLQRQGYDLVPVSELHRGVALGTEGRGSALAAGE
ncbi:MAG: polysaccharide deacetylase family protein [Candidatus Methylomirabilales bacterium]